jgi:hypothetical protein
LISSAGTKKQLFMYARDCPARLCGLIARASRAVMMWLSFPLPAWSVGVQPPSDQPATCFRQQHQPHRPHPHLNLQLSFVHTPIAITTTTTPSTANLHYYSASGYRSKPFYRRIAVVVWTIRLVLVSNLAIHHRSLSRLSSLDCNFSHHPDRQVKWPASPRQNGNYSTTSSACPHSANSSPRRTVRRLRALFSSSI